MSHILGTLGWGSGPKTSDSPASVAVLVSIHPAALMTWRLMPAAFPDWSCMLVTLQFWGVGVLLHFYGSLGVSLVGTLRGTPASMGLLDIPLVGTLCGGSTLMTSLCLDPQAIHNIFWNLGWNHHAIIALALCIPAGLVLHGHCQSLWHVSSVSASWAIAGPAWATVEVAKGHCPRIREQSYKA